MSAVPRRCGTASPAILLLLAAACSTLQTGFPAESGAPARESFLARQYVQRGRAAWAMGNQENARFLLGRAVELDPLSPETVAAWSAYWPLDSLPSGAAAARTAALAARATPGAAAAAGDGAVTPDPSAGGAVAAPAPEDSGAGADAAPADAAGQPAGADASGEGIDVGAGSADAAAGPGAAPAAAAAAPPAGVQTPADAPDPVDELAAAMGAVTGG
ncbi:MAG TPA: hypothetical protein VIC56_05795, partial [Gemmatimonadota bacterium]